MVNEFVSVEMMVDGEVVYFREGFGWHLKRKRKQQLSEKEKEVLRERIEKRLLEYVQLLKK